MAAFDPGNPDPISGSLESVGFGLRIVGNPGMVSDKFVLGIPEYPVPSWLVVFTSSADCPPGKHTLCS